MEVRWSVVALLTYTHSYTPNRMTANAVVLPPPTILPGQYSPAALAKTPYANITGSTSLGRYDPYAPPRKPAGASAPIASTSSIAKPTGNLFLLFI